MTAAAASSQLNEADHLAALLTQQRDLYRELGGLSARQQELIDASRTEELLGVLTQRQSLIDRLTACNKEVAPLRSRLGDIAAAAPAATRDTIRDRVDEVQGLLEEIIGRDEADRAKLEASRKRGRRVFAPSAGEPPRETRHARCGFSDESPAIPTQAQRLAPWGPGPHLHPLRMPRRRCDAKRPCGLNR